MSRDQRPARMRVVSSGQRAEQQHRRRGDAPPVDAPVPGEQAQPVPAQAAAAGSPWLIAMLFVIGCALGGALIALSGLFEVPGR